ncbi:hypothetical protein QW131_30885 [Roseibium salinum]|nr:hypothetical protein [Roseibium salinum]
MLRHKRARPVAPRPVEPDLKQHQVAEKKRRLTSRQLGSGFQAIALQRRKPLDRRCT